MFSLTLVHRLACIPARLSTLFAPSPSRDLVVDLTLGQREVLELRRGDTVLVLLGAATLHHAPHWLGDTLVRHGTELGEGEAHFSREPEVVTLVARSTSRVRRLGSARRRDESS